MKKKVESGSKKKISSLQPVPAEERKHILNFTDAFRLTRLCTPYVMALSCRICSFARSRWTRNQMKFKSVNCILAVPDSIDGANGKQVIIRFYGIRGASFNADDATMLSISRLVDLDSKTKVFRFGKFDLDNVIAKNFEGICNAREITKVVESVRTEEKNKVILRFEFSKDEQKRLCFVVDPYGGVHRNSPRIRPVTVLRDALEEMLKTRSQREFFDARCGDFIERDENHCVCSWCTIPTFGVSSSLSSKIMNDVRTIDIDGGVRLIASRKETKVTNALTTKFLEKIVETMRVEMKKKKCKVSAAVMFKDNREFQIFLRGGGGRGTSSSAGDSRVTAGRHAEQLLLEKCGDSLKTREGILIVTLAPCPACAAAIANALREGMKITHVIFCQADGIDLRGVHMLTKHMEKGHVVHVPWAMNLRTCPPASKCLSLRCLGNAWYSEDKARALAPSLVHFKRGVSRDVMEKKMGAIKRGLTAFQVLAKKFEQVPQTLSLFTDKFATSTFRNLFPTRSDELVASSGSLVHITLGDEGFAFLKSSRQYLKDARFKIKIVRRDSTKEYVLLLCLSVFLFRNYTPYSWNGRTSIKPRTFSCSSTLSLHYENIDCATHSTPEC